MYVASKIYGIYSCPSTLQQGWVFLADFLLCLGVHDFVSSFKKLAETEASSLGVLLTPELPDLLLKPLLRASLERRGASRVGFESSLKKIAEMFASCSFGFWELPVLPWPVSELKALQDIRLVLSASAAHWTDDIAP